MCEHRRVRLLPALGGFILLAAPLLSAGPIAKVGPEERGRGGRRNRPDLAPVVGDVAPNFKLKRLGSEGEVELAGFKGKKPVVLIFGSYT